VTLDPAQPFYQVVEAAGLAAGQRASVTLFDQDGSTVLHYDLILP